MNWINDDTNLAEMTRATVQSTPFLEGAEVSTFETCRHTIRARFESLEFWTLVFDRVSNPAVHEITQSHYQESVIHEDISVFVVELEDGQQFAVGSFRKRMMSGRALNRIIRKWSPVSLSDREIVEQDVLILVPQWKLRTGRSLIAAILDPSVPIRAEADLAMN